MAEVVIFYHGGDCLDGLLSAFTIWSDTEGKSILYPMQPGQTPPEVTGKIVYILDICFSKEITFKMISQAKALLVIDHHESSAEVMTVLPEANKIWSKQESACVLTWKYLYPNIPIPEIYKYVQAYDLWKKDSLPNVDAFILGLSKAVNGENNRPNIALLKKYMVQTEVTNLIEEGLKGLEYQNFYLAKILSHVNFFPVRLPAHDGLAEKIIVVGYVNSAFLISALSEKCFETYPFVDLFVCYWIDGATQQTQICLRSTDERTDALWIAQQFGGGGHRNSSSFRVNNLTCRLNFEHLDPMPFMCMFKRKTYRAKWDNLGLITVDYMNLLKTKFPDREFSMVVVN